MGTSRELTFRNAPLYRLTARYPAFLKMLTLTVSVTELGFCLKCLFRNSDNRAISVVDWEFLSS